MEQLNFKDEELKVNWIALNCQKLDKSNLKKVKRKKRSRVGNS